MRTATKGLDRRASILVVDDEAHTLFVLRDILEDDGYEVRTAARGEEGLRLFQESPADLVIADQRMPGMTGVEMLIRMAALRPDCVRIILSAYADFDAVLKAVNEGDVYRFFLKPWNPDEMLLTVRTALDHLEAQRSRTRLLDELRQKNLELVRAAEELKRAQDALVRSEKMAAVGKVAGNMVHEIGNHLFLLTAAKRLQERHAEDEDLATFLSAVSGLSNIIHGMLEGYKYYLHGRELPFRWAPCKLPDLLTETVEVMRQAPYAHGREIVFEPAGEVELITDRNKLRQVVVNLVKNACQATDSNMGRIAISYALYDNRLWLRVEDNGRGIPPEDEERIWQPFFSTRGNSGLGLGLDICRTFVEGLGGTIQCRSTPGAGTVFLVELPLA